MTEPDRWRDWTLVALATRRPAGSSRAERELSVIEQVAILFADRFDPADRAYDAGSRPQWHAQVRAVIADLREHDLLGARDVLTAAGQADADRARDAAAAAAPVPPADLSPADGPLPLLTPGVIAAPLRDPEARRKMGFHTADDAPIPVMAELNLRSRAARTAAFHRLDGLWGGSPAAAAPTRIAEPVRDRRAVDAARSKRLVAADAVPVVWSERSLYRVWPDFPVQLHVDGSCVTIKADAARRSFDAYGEDVVWAVVDTGIDGDHPHFAALPARSTSATSRDLHRDFTGRRRADPGRRADRRDRPRHARRRHHRRGGRAVAGRGAGRRPVRATESRHNPENPQERCDAPRTAVDDPELLAGMAPGPSWSASRCSTAAATSRPGAPGDRGAALRARGQRRQRQT